MKTINKVFMLGTICFLAVSNSIFSSDLFVPFGEIGRIPASESLSVRVETKNDSYSKLSRTDWDDLRSFGMYYGFSMRRWTIEATTDSLTNRTNNVSTGGRIDQVSLAVTRQVKTFEKDTLTIGISVGAGTFFLGNWGMAEIQTIVHEISNTSYDIPEKYDVIQQPTIITADAILHARIETSFAPISFYSTIEAGHTGFFRTGNYIETEFSNGFLGTRLVGGFQWIPEYRRSGDSFYRTLKSETGIYLGTVFSAGFLESGFSYNINTTRPAGYVALSFSDKIKSEQDGHKADSIDAIEFRLQPLLAGIRLRRSLQTGTPVVSAFMGAESGPFMETDMLVPSDEHYRYEQIYFGLETAFALYTWMDVYAAGALGYRKDIWTTRTLIATRILDDREAGVLLAEGGVRLYLPTKKTTANEWGMGAAFEVLFIDAFEKGIRTGTHLYVVATSNRRTNRISGHRK